MRNRRTTMAILMAVGAAGLAGRVTRAAVEYGPIKNPTNGHIYFLLSEEPFPDAEAEARNMRGYLVKIDDETECKWVTGTFATSSIRWIGYNSRFNRGKWEWYDGTSGLYTNWTAGEPNNPTGERYCQMYAGATPASATWNDTSGGSYKAIVEAEDCNDDMVPDSSNDAGLTGSYVIRQTPSFTVVSAFNRIDPVIDFSWIDAVSATLGPDDSYLQVYLWDEDLNGFDLRRLFDIHGSLPQNYVAANWSGALRPTKSEHFTFYLLSGGGYSITLRNPDGSILHTITRLDDKLSSHQFTVPLEAGKSYPIDLSMSLVGFQTNNSAVPPNQIQIDITMRPYFRLEWSSPTTDRAVVPPSVFVPGASVDCNNNFIADECDISNGTSADCNNNQIPDECELATSDCDNNGKIDSCEIATNQTFYDCNNNNKLDFCETRDGQVADIDGNHVPDSCQTGQPEIRDCNQNNVPDGTDLQQHTSTDCDGDGVPDECQIKVGTQPPSGIPPGPFFCTVNCRDCNGNGIPDACDIADGRSEDCDHNNFPDECQIPVAQGGKCADTACPGSDCNGNHKLDVCDINTGLEQDCNNNSLPDTCDIRDGVADDCNHNQIPDDCELAGQDCNGNSVPDSCDIQNGDLLDCNQDGVADVCEVTSVLASITGSASSTLFRTQRSFGSTYKDMIAAYGKPWQAGLHQKPGLLPTDEPASRMRALFSLRSCDADVNNIAPVLPELYSFEMALGNEAYADAIDPTIGLTGITSADLGDKFAFQGVPGINSLLDEELALLRGRELPGSPPDWLDDSLYYPAFSTVTQTIKAAVYNRLPPNADNATGSVAYVSNYGPGINSNFDAAVRYPQGHGDAFGYYLTALKFYLTTFRGNPADSAAPESVIASDYINLQPTTAEAIQAPNAGVVSVPYQGVRQMVTAMAARARTVVKIAERTYRRDYREDPEDPDADQVLADTDAERAWATGDWARRGAIGAYLDWAVGNQLLPESPPLDPNQPQGAPLGTVDRRSVNELGELATAVSDLQELMDRAGAGINPLGLIPNVVPFGINASELGTANGKSHYEQVREAAVAAVTNVREVLNWSNQGAQRLREQGESQQTFAQQVDDMEADFNNRLIELFGYPSQGDPADNDGDPTTTDAQEAQSAPDLVNFMLDEKGILKAGFGKQRIAPGEIQIAIQDVQSAGTKLEEARKELEALGDEIQDIQSFRAFLAGKGQDLNTIYDQFGTKLGDIKTDTIDKIAKEVEHTKNASRALRFIGTVTINTLQGVAAGAALDDSNGYVQAVVTGIIGGVAGGCIASADLMDAIVADKEEGAKFDYEARKAKLNVWKDAQLKQVDIDIQNQEQYLRLQSLIRQTPQKILDIELAEENLQQAVNRLSQTVQRGQRLVSERERVRKIKRDQLQQYRWGDLAYRNFRNNALQKYDAFFDLAARYVMLAGRAYAYEYNSRTQAYQILEKICRERTLGNPTGSSGGLQGIITDLDNLAQVNKFNSPLATVGERTFSLRTNLLGLTSTSANSLRFRSYLENHIVQNLQELPAVQDYLQLSVTQHYGPAIVVPFFTEVAGNNFFGNGPDAPFANTNFPVSLNTKIRNFAVRLVGVNPDAIGVDRANGFVSVFLIPTGQSILRENTNAPTVEENEPRPWAVVDQWLPAPPLVSIQNPAVQSRNFSPWVSTANSGGNYLNSVKRFREMEAQIDLGQPIDYRPDLAGRAVWNTEWLLIIPGGQWTSSSDGDAIRNRLLAFIYGPTAEPTANAGITDIRLIIQAYAN